ncbi:MAG: methyltransferase, partial [Glaciecola sp.]
MNNTVLTLQNESFSLKRFPANTFDKSLRAWDAADEYIINHVCEHVDLSTVEHIAIANDGFGALSCAMARLAPQATITVFTDSYMSELAIAQNLTACNLDKNNVSVKSALNIDCLQGTKVDLVLLKVPRTLSYLAHLLLGLNQVTHSDTLIISGAMIKLVTSSAIKTFDKYLLNTKTSLAKKKARLIFSEQKPCDVNEFIEFPINEVSDDSLDFTLHNYANVFCREQVDIGARYMLNALPKLRKQDAVVIDLGCGNGILGTSMLGQYPSANVVFVDESYMGIASAQRTLEQSGANSSNAQFLIAHCLQDYPPNSADVVICNPPFHQQNTVIDDIAWQMFLDAKRVLRPGGELRIVGNRHLDHRVKLSK